MGNALINKKSLAEKLQKAGVSREYYSLNGYKETALCMETENGKWIVYEGERGNRYNPEIFDNEADACISFCKRIKDFI